MPMNRRLMKAGGGLWCRLCSTAGASGSAANKQQNSKYMTLLAQQRRQMHLANTGQAHLLDIARVCRLPHRVAKAAELGEHLQADGTHRARLWRAMQSVRKQLNLVRARWAAELGCERGGL